MSTFNVVLVNTETNERQTVAVDTDVFGRALQIAEQQAGTSWKADRDETVCPEGSRFRVEFRLAQTGYYSRLVSSCIVTARTRNEAAQQVPGATYFQGQPNVEGPLGADGRL